MPRACPAQAAGCAWLRVAVWILVTCGVFGGVAYQGRNRRRRYAGFCKIWVRDVGPDAQGAVTVPGMWDRGSSAGRGARMAGGRGWGPHRGRGMRALGFRHGMRYRQNTPDTHESARSRHWVMGPFTWSWSGGRHTFGMDTGGDRIGSSRTRSRRRRARRSSKCIAGATRPRCCGPGTGCPAIGCRSVDRPGPAPKVSEPVLVLS